MNGLDLFSGIGGIAYGLRDYIVPVAYCEKDEYCQRVLIKQMQSGEIGTAPIWDDVTTFPCKDIGEVDIITAGFPCQDISVAGKGAGLAGERSGLFFEVMRCVDELQPRFLFLENVSAIRTRGLDQVLKELADRRYDARWCCVSAYEAGAPHQRKRWFLLGYSNSVNPRTNKDLEGEQVASGAVARNFCGTSSEGGNGPVGEQFVTDSTWWTTEPDVGRVAYGVSSRVDRLKGLGNSVVPQQCRIAFEYLLFGRHLNAIEAS
jgi:DNA (cytosine-5)-methyltransferase 1